MKEQYQDRDTIEKALLLMQEINELASKKYVRSDLKDEISNQKEYFQNVLNGLLSKGGLLTKDQLDMLDEQTRIQKMNLVEIKSKMAKNKLIAVGILTAVILGGLFLYTSKK